MNCAKKLFMTDLDGTALGGGYEPYDRFPDHFSDFLDSLVERGWEWAINTTWDPQGQWKLIERSKVRSRPAFLIAEYGRQLVQVRNGNPERVDPYCTDNDVRIAEYCKTALLPLLQKLFSRIQPRQVFYYEHLVSIEFREELVRENCPALVEAARSGLFWIGGKGRQLALRPSFLSKGLPFNILRDQFGYQPENIACAGDEITDLDMMRKENSRIWLAPGNVCAELKEILKANGGFVGERSQTWGVIDAFQQWEKSLS